MTRPLRGKRRGEMVRSSSQIAWLSAFLVCAACVYAGVVLGLSLSPPPQPSSSSSSSTAALGWVAATGAALVFSTTTIPMKIPGLSEIDPMVFAFFTLLGSFLVSVPLSIYLQASDQFRYEPLSILGAADIFVINFFALQAVSHLGVATAPGVWAGVGMVTSFVVGALGFKESISNPKFAGAAIALLVVGVYCVSTSKGPTSDGESSPTEPSPCPTEEAQVVAALEELELQVVHDKGVEDAQTQAQAQTQMSSGLSVGVLFCLATGICDGCLMVPFKAAKADSAVATLSYLASFGLSGAFVSPCLYGAYLLASRRPVPTLDQLRLGSGPGIASGILWACANILSVLGTFSLGMSISFPLTQCCAVIGAGWGLGFFAEKIDHYARFALGLALVVLGAVLLSLSHGE